MKIFMITVLSMIVVLENQAQGLLKAIKEEIAKDERRPSDQFGQRWVKVSFGNQIPADAVVGGKDLDGGELLVAHANYFGSWYPGKTRRNWNLAHIEFNEHEFKLGEYEVLAGNSGLVWSNVNQGQIPFNAVEGGKDNQNTFFVCRCEFQGTTQIGKTYAGKNACSVAYGGKGHDVAEYQVLVQSQNNNPSYSSASSPVQSSVAPVQTNANPPVVSSGVSAHGPDLKVYSNYDFVPGENILFEDDFSDDQDGEFPAKWDLERGQAVLNKTDGGLALFVTQGNYAKLNPRLKTQSYLTDPFTVEVDFLIQSEKRNGIRIFLECTEGEKSISYGQDGSVSSDYFPNNFSSPFPEPNAKLNGQWHHAAFIFKRGQIKCYLDQHRVLLMPNTQVTPVSVKFGGIGDIDNPIIFRNVRIASGGSMNMIGKRFTDSKIVTHGIHFDNGRATILPESMGTINMIKDILVNNPDLKFEIGGHTDSDGDAASNLRLSQDRAEAVRQLLIDLGVDRARLTTKGYGLSRPVSDNNSPEGKANNRRVEFVRF